MKHIPINILVLRQLILDRDLTVRKLAALSSVSESTIRRLLNGSQDRVRKETLIRIAKVLKAKQDDLAKTYSRKEIADNFEGVVPF